MKYRLKSIFLIGSTMAILGFHFSGIYKDVLFSGKKSATIMSGENYFSIGEEVQVYLSEKENLFEGNEEKRIGKATIKEVKIKKAGHLTENEAKLCGSKDLNTLSSALKKWYNCKNDSVITFVRFELEIF